MQGNQLKDWMQSSDIIRTVFRKLTHVEWTKVD